MTPWTDCPVCSACRCPTMVSTDSETGRPLPGTTLECRACGASRVGTAEERAQAERADAAWEAELQREGRVAATLAARRESAAWLAAAGSAARPAPEPRQEPESLPLPGVLP